jgi:hypothetical protein
VHWVTTLGSPNRPSGALKVTFLADCVTPGSSIVKVVSKSG